MVAEAEMDANINLEASEIQKFFKGARIFITGGSGFLGNLLIQKLVRDCPDIDKLYLLIRAKRGKTPEDRIVEMFTDPVFDRMKEEQPKYTEKIKLMIGDIEQRELGLNEEDKKLIADQVNIVFHIAATVRLDGKIKKAALINVRATKDLIQIAKTITNLKAYVHVSTAYSHCIRSEIKEQFYDVAMPPDRLIQMAEILNDDELDILTPKLIGEWPNTYSFTKALAENVIQNHGKGLPIAIFRPSMVISTYKDPLEGWINNMYGPVGIAIAQGTGLSHVQQIKLDHISDMVPGDYVVNSMIAAAYHIGNTFNHSKNNSENNIIFDELESSNETNIFNYVSGTENPLKWGEFSKFAARKGLSYIPVQTLWYYFVIYTESEFAAKFYSLLFHTIPAHIVDAVLFVLGKKFRLTEIYKKFEELSKVILFVVMHEWEFSNDNTQALWQNLNNTDRRLFPFSMKELSWADYFNYFGRGLRIYLIKDPLETLPAAKAKYQKLKIAHYCLVSVFSLIILTVVYRIFLLFL